MSTADALDADEGERRVTMIVAHPDDEVLWAGGLLLMHPTWQWRIITLCRGDDPDRSDKFNRFLKQYGLEGRMGTLADEPNQMPLPAHELQGTILDLVENPRVDLIITHSPVGEYTRHRRHVEAGLTVGALWTAGLLCPKQVWMFAYHDAKGRHLPEAIDSAHRVIELPDDVWRAKYQIITDLYGFSADSFEARTTPRTEAFWCFSTPNQYTAWRRTLSRSWA